MGRTNRLWLLAKCLNTPIEVYVQPKKGMLTPQHIFQPVCRGNDLTEPIRLLFSNAHYDALVCSQKVQQKVQHDRAANVPFAAQASWTWHPETAEHKGGTTKAELVRKQEEDLDELSSRVIPYKLTHAVLERT